MPLRNNVEVRAQRIILRVFSATDAREAFEAMTPSLSKFMSWEVPKTPADFEKVWKGWEENRKRELEIVFVIRDRKTQEFLGLVGLHRLTTAPRIGIWIKEVSHGCGYGKASVQAVIEWAAQELGIEQFSYSVAEENIASQRIAQSLGGVKNGYLVGSKYNAQIYKIMHHVPIFKEAL